MTDYKKLNEIEKFIKKEFKIGFDKILEKHRNVWEIHGTCKRKCKPRFSKKQEQLYKEIRDKWNRQK